MSFRNPAIPVLKNLFGNKPAWILCLAVVLPAQIQAQDLMEIFKAIQKNDPSWRANVHAHQAGKQNKGIGRAYLLPSVTVSGEHKTVDNKPECTNESPPTCGEEEYDSTAYQVELIQPLFNKEGWHTYREGKAQSELAELEFNQALQSNIYDTTTLYFDVLRAQEDYNLAKSEQEALETQLKELEAKAKAGVVDRTEVIETQASLDLATVNQITLIGYLKVAYEDLVTYTGIAKPTVMRLSPDYPIAHIEPFDESLWVNKANTNSPNLLAIRKKVEVARQSYKRNTSAIYPRIDLFANAAHREQEGGLYSENGNSESVGVRLRWPIFAGLGDYYTAKQQKLQYLQNSEEAESEAQDFTQFVRNRFRSIYTDVLRVEAQQKSLRSSERALKAVQAQYELGSRDMIDVLNAQKQFYSAKKAYSHARYDYVLDMMQLKLFVGELSIEDLEALNQWLVPDKTLLNLDTLP